LWPVQVRSQPWSAIPFADDAFAASAMSTFAVENYCCRPTLGLRDVSSPRRRTKVRIVELASTSFMALLAQALVVATILI
jgi:hypothetical protein